MTNLQIVFDGDCMDVMPSELGRTFATLSACVGYCKREGFTQIARLTGNSGVVFYAPFLPELPVAGLSRAPNLLGGFNDEY